MSKFKLEIVTAEGMIVSQDVDAVVAPGIEGQLGILPLHAPLMTMLDAGELMVRSDGHEEYLAVTGGFLEVRAEKVIVLADACERAEAIDVERAEAARKRAEERLKLQDAGMDTARTEAALRRSLARLRIAGLVRHRKKAR